MAAPLVSVVVRAFKPNEWIFEAVGSVIKQTYRGPVEVVVCYDKASNTPHILDKLRELANQTPANRAVRVVEHEPMGPAHAFFECGLRQSRGDYVMFLDYDNVMPSDYVERVLSHAEGDKCLCTNPMKIDKDGRLLNMRVMQVPKKISVATLAWGNFCDTNGIVLPRKAVDTILKKYDDKLKRLRLLNYLLVDDYLCALICAKHFGIKYIEDTYVYYRVHEEQLVHAMRPDTVKNNQQRLRDITTLYELLILLGDQLTSTEKVHISASMISHVFKIISSTIGKSYVVKGLILKFRYYIKRKVFRNNNIIQ